MSISLNAALSRRAVLRGGAIAAAGIGLGGCTRMLSQANALLADVEVREDLAFGPHARHRLDLYLPEDATPVTPMVLFLYGGSWRWGSRGRYGFVGTALAERGFAVAVADYRLHPEVSFPAFNHDAARAAAWLQGHRGEFGLAPGPLHLMGHSAGAHIAALLALDARYLDGAGLPRAQLGRLVGLSGPYGMYPSRIRLVADIFPAADDETRPVTYARADAPPMLLLHGADDNIVGPRNTLGMAAAQTAAGGSAEARIYPDLGHRGVVMALTVPFHGLAPVLDDTVAFLTAATPTS